MKLSIIIVSWNVQEKLKKNLEAIFLSDTNFDFEVFVVDNNSKDQTVEMIENNFPQVVLIDNDKNMGFAKANNQAINKAKGDYVLLLNPDMLPKKDTFRNITDWIQKNNQAWVAGCHLKSEDKKTILQVRRFPQLFDQLAIVLKIPHIIPSILDDYLRIDFDYDKSAKVDSVRGGFFLINKSKFTKTPLFDERYFLWFEEVDFCKQVYRDGGEVWYCADAECIDFVGQSFEQVKRRTAQRYFRKSMLEYFKKWGGKFTFLILYLAWIPIISFAWLVDTVGIKPKAKT